MGKGLFFSAFPPLFSNLILDHTLVKEYHEASHRPER